MHKPLELIIAALFLIAFFLYAITSTGWVFLIIPAFYAGMYTQEARRKYPILDTWF